MDQEAFQEISKTIPQDPGIYKYYDVRKELLYVGKAKNLRKRVSSYFNKTFANYKTYELVKRISAIEFTIVNSEQDAFLLENSLIKQYQPRFNINLKDDKSYPFIVLKKEPFPRVFLTRRKIEDGSEYLGPFTSVAKVRELIEFIKSSVQLRTCKLNLSSSNIAKKKFRVCLEYHLGNCKGPCEGLQSEADYLEGLKKIRNMLKGNLAPVISSFRQEMKESALNLEFEKAEIIRKKIDHLENYQARSVIVSKNLQQADVFSMFRDEGGAYINYLMVQNGTIVQTHTTEAITQLEETDEEILAFSIAQLRDRFNSQAPEIIVPFAIEFPQEGIIITVPKGGDKKKLLDLSEKNVNYYREEAEKKKMLHLMKKTPEERTRVLEQLQKDLQLSSLPVHIECFDNSNFQGSFPVSAMVCFINGVESKKDYRHFNVKTVEGINDFATMKEVVYRRYKRLAEDGSSLPQLVIIDGGKGQLSAALESIDVLGLKGKMTLVGLAKNEEEIFFAGDQESLKLPYDSVSLKFIRKIRDEVHRFGISFHRNKRSRGTFQNELENIPGIGKQTADQLLKIFHSVKKVKAATEAELSNVTGAAKAKMIIAYFEKKQEEETQAGQGV
ncbi:MAG: excinuclease ABC subunit UvrC [Bacteroidota bacterium]|nr:excinuclease ABC subunit UvrC [Bacteroidota bacterium]MDP4213009.1 excinuclease ABC subunit UvrC [Bacteroidota bacterium]